MVCKNNQTILEKKSTLLEWLTNDPCSIMKKAKKMNTATPEAEYLADLDKQLKGR